MWIRRLNLGAFRCHAQGTLSFVEGVNVIAGSNGSGKTSILEAVHLLATGRSFRSGEDRQLVRDGHEYAIVRGAVHVQNRDVELAVAVGDPPGKSRGERYRVNGAPRRSLKDFTGILRTVVFSPDDLDLVKGGPSARRNFIDTVASTLRPAHGVLVSDYERVLRQRNSLLRTLPRGTARGVGDVSPTLETWTELLAEKGGELTASRLVVLGDLQGPFSASARRLGILDPEISYSTEWTAGGGISSGDLRDDLLETLTGLAAREKERGVTMAGPHRDDISLGMDSRDARTRASQGEQRSLALALRVAELDLHARSFDEMPVLLLDDVLSELDESHQESLFEMLPAAQTLLTVATEEKEIPAEIEGPIGDFARDRGLERSFLRLDEESRP